MTYVFLDDWSIKVKKSGFILLVSILWSSQSFASSSCDSEFTKFCENSNDVNCPDKNRSKFSQSCKDELKKLDEQSKGFSSHCLVDIEKLCPVNEARFDKLGMAYMKEHKACITKMKPKFSDKCREQIKTSK